MQSGAASPETLIKVEESTQAAHLLRGGFAGHQSSPHPVWKEAQETLTVFPATIVLSQGRKRIAGKDQSYLGLSTKLDALGSFTGVPSRDPSKSCCHCHNVTKAKIKPLGKLTPRYCNKACGWSLYFFSNVFSRLFFLQGDTHVWQSENNVQEWILSFHHVSYRDGAHAISLVVSAFIH